MWHASAAPTAGHIILKPTLHARALQALDGVGDRAHEWHEWSGYAYHVRRRVTDAEALRVGEVRDIRGTPDAEARFRRMAPWLGPLAHRVAREELQRP